MVQGVVDAAHEYVQPAGRARHGGRTAHEDAAQPEPGRGDRRDRIGEAPPIELRQVKERPRRFSGSPTDVHLGAALIQRFAEVFLEPAA